MYSIAFTGRLTTAESDRCLPTHSPYVYSEYVVPPANDQAIPVLAGSSGVYTFAHIATAGGDSVSVYSDWVSLAQRPYLGIDCM